MACDSRPMPSDPAQWTLIGEKGKYIALSPQRFSGNSFGDSGNAKQEVTVSGTPGEQVKRLVIFWFSFGSSLSLFGG